MTTAWAWWQQVQADILAPEAGRAAVCCLCGHSGTYIGKATVRRSTSTGLTFGLAARAAEHLCGLLRPPSRDGGLKRYAALRSS
eukprot:8893154-Pyramimonas_sp.AAC.1